MTQQAARATNRFGDAVRGAHHHVARYAALYASLRIGGIVARTSDAYIELNNRLRQVTDSERDLIRTREDLYRISQRTRSDLDTNAALFSKMRIATERLGLSSEDAARIVEILNKQVAIGGSNAVACLNGPNRC